MRWIPPEEVARRRIIEDFAISEGKGKIVAHGRSFDIAYDDVLDIAQAVEMVMLKLTGKLLRPQFRPEVKNLKALQNPKVIGGDCSLYDGPSGEQPMPPSTTCEVTGHIVKTHYMRVEIDGNRWDSWFGRLDELAKCLYVIVREAQGDPYTGGGALFIGAKGPIPFQAPGAGHG